LFTQPLLSIGEVLACDLLALNSMWMVPKRVSWEGDIEKNKKNNEVVAAEALPNLSCSVMTFPKLSNR
jgi:hypothetical protein